MGLSSSEHCEEYLGCIREGSFLLAEGLLFSPKESTKQRSGAVSTPPSTYILTTTYKSVYHDMLYHFLYKHEINQ
jgi:hypothetical protein